MNLPADLEQKLRTAARSVFSGQKLAPYTTLGVGGPADFVVIAETAGELMETVRVCAALGVRRKILGGGSNVIISDRGFRGVVIINRYRDVEVLDGAPDVRPMPRTRPRLTPLGGPFYDLTGLEYSDADAPPVRVRVGSGARIVPLMKTLYRKNITGLQWFAGIPATVGGAIYMNMHGARDFFGDLVCGARLFDGETLREVNHDWFHFDYDWCRLHETADLLLDAELLLRRGNPRLAWELSRDWARRKALQPQKSAGCIFQNLTPAEQHRLGLPTPSIGYLVDKVLGLKGLRQGDAVVSNAHAAFIENRGGATAADVYALYRRIVDAAREHLDLELRPEVEFIGDF